MNGDFALTDHMAELKRAVSKALNQSSISGRAVPFSEAEIITGKFNTAVALARELEEENRILEHRIRALRDAEQNLTADAPRDVAFLKRSPTRQK
ncbi:hypothetical protein [Shinella kummerowiae]|uniref:hypothetical protein n=1 Tax=Shinella kummerowiae TaxID=417745 RepID=UPI0021B6ABEE|nr:hypothetical protein [Shinella kummerowiae]MCT7667646.1 hypothetical protein [Shinella kummerowiae]